MVPRVVGSNPIIHPSEIISLIFNTVGDSGFFIATLLPIFFDDFNLVDNPENRNIFPFKEAKLNCFDDDISQQWYVEFWAWSVETGKIKRKRMFQVNKHNNISERHKFAEIQIAEINKLLSSGFHFDNGKRADNKRKNMLEKGMIKLSAIDALTEMHNNIAGAYRDSTKNSYTSKLNSFVKYLKRENAFLRLTEIEPTHSRGFVGYLSGVEGNENRTINSKVQYIKSLLDRLKEDNVLKENPFEK